MTERNAQSTTTPVTFRILIGEDVEAFRELRIRGLKESPEAFGADYSEWISLPLEEVVKILTYSSERFVLGAFESSGALVAIAGFRRRSGKKVRHTGEIWGVYVAPTSRGRGLGKAIMLDLIERARRCDGLTRLILTVSDGNDGARILYESLGFYKYGTDEGSLRIDKRYLDEHLMSMKLQAVK